ncbi:hypothetical protein [Thermogemmatispora onikobensis]|uniref:hypothetical protein n=1 Tax=Thermogemmatispora onikobensis TaxID=732234 RepID=UPI00085339C7|nr:hypothetical protein [Thermogemmatispora onikobensis]
MTLERTVWLQERRRLTAERYDQLAPDYDRDWGTLDETHTTMLLPLLARLPQGSFSCCNAPQTTGQRLRHKHKKTSIDPSEGIDGRLE